MSEWKNVKLKDVADIFSGYAFKSKDMNNNCGTPLIKIKNINDFIVSTECDSFLNLDIDLSKWEKYRLQINDFLIAMTGQGSVGRVGKMMNYSSIYFVNQRVAIVRPNCNLVNPYFLYKIFATNERQLELFKKANGAGQPNISPSQIGDVEFYIPNIKNQCRIATILSRYDSLIENYQKQIKLLEESAQRLYKEWFIDLRFPGHENTKIVDGVPEGWEMISINDLVGKLESGSRPKGGIDTSIKDGVASVGAENVIGLGQYNFSSEKLVSYDFYNNAKKGRIGNKDILIYKDGAYIGRTSLFQGNFPHKEAMVNEHVFLLHTNKEVNQYFLFFTLYQKVYFDKMQKLNKNAAQPGLNQNAIKSLKLLMPNEILIIRFDEIINPMMKVLFDLANQIHNLTEARDRLLPKLMSGEIKV